ncbi:MAG: hypothetical protein HQL27_01440 [Candidatus Omnitrophica bacterium]|nr:hypothetical protein [Candidatus Omnitrophota bacterium]
MTTRASPKVNLDEGLQAGTDYSSEVKKPEITSQELIKQLWDANSQNNLKKVEKLTAKCLSYYGAEAKKEQTLLKGFPARGEEDVYQSLNDVGGCLFIHAEELRDNGKKEEAIKECQDVIDNYGWSQQWDPSRGAWWSVAQTCQDLIDDFNFDETKEEAKTERKEIVKPALSAPGKEKVIDYTKYGKFKDVGKPTYKYSIADVDGLSAAVGEGIYPNTSDVYNNPRYKEVKASGRMEGSHWDFVRSPDLEAAYFKWSTAPEPWGVKLFYLGLIFEKAQMWHEALKSYHSIIVHFPKTVAWTYWQTPWYPGQAAIAKIRHILRIHPELGLAEKWMKIDVKNGFDNDPKNDEIITFPGKIVKENIIDQTKARFNIRKKVALRKIKKTVGKGKIVLVQYENNHWQLMVAGKPYIIKGITYAPTKIGQSPDKGTLKNWMEEDSDNNGKIDGPYDSWVDANKNNLRDADEPVVGDFQLMKEMGVNTIRVYDQPNYKVNKRLLNDMFKSYGIRVILGNFLGKYAIGSGADWSEGTDYDNPTHKKNMLENLKKMVLEHKDEPYLLMWLLGNENNYGVASNADKKPESYYKFADEAARMIKKIDPNHPVALNNGDTQYLDIFAKNCPNVDIFTGNVYRGDYGFGSFWEQVADSSGKPAFITEYGCPAYAAHLQPEERDEAQAEYHRGNWLDISDNSAGYRDGVGNALGGVAFEWLDEWWKNYQPYRHDRKSEAIGPFPGGYYFEEWFGLISQGKGQHSPFLRQPRKVYYLYKDLWNEAK